MLCDSLPTFGWLDKRKRIFLDDKVHETIEICQLCQWDQLPCEFFLNQLSLSFQPLAVFFIETQPFSFVS